MSTTTLTVNRANKSTRAKYKRLFICYLFLIPSFLFIATFFYYPAAMALFHGFTNWDLARTEWVGLDNFKRLVMDGVFVTSSINQMIFTVAELIKNLTFPLIAAELIFLLPLKRWRYIYRTGFILPMLVPSLVSILLWLSIYNPNYGLLSQTLTSLGLSDLNKPWLADTSTAMWAVIFVGFPFISGLPFLIYYAAIGSFNQEIIEASRIDGATGWKVFTRMHLPLLLPQFKIIAILTILGSLQDIVKIMVLTNNGGPGTATVIPALTMYTVAFTSSEYGYASAIGTALFLVIILVTIFNLKFMKTDN